MYFSTRSVPSCWGMLVYRDLTSTVTSKQSLGAFVRSILFIASVVSESRWGTSVKACLRVPSNVWEAIYVGPFCQIQ